VWDRSLRTLNYFNRYTLSIGILLVAVVFSPDPGASRAVGALHDFAHAPIFGCVALLILIGLKRRSTQGWAISTEYLTAFVGAVLLGLATEVAQKFAARDPSWLDLRSNALGAAAFCALFAAFDPRVGRLTQRIGAALAGVALLVFHSLPLANVMLAYAHRNQDFPTLFDARDARADKFVAALRSEMEYVPLPSMFAKQVNEPTLHVRFTTGPWPGLDLDEPYPDWSGYRALMLDLTNPSGTELPMTIRVHDRTHDWSFGDRFNRNFTLAPRTRTTYTIAVADIEHGPAARRLQVREIADLALFTTQANVGRDLYVSRIWLE
jgi:hypothetical protein